MKLNLGCGTSRFPGFINIDINKDLEPDFIVDLGKDNLPFESSTIDEIWCCHTLEHIVKKYHENLFLEIHRVLKLKSKLYLTFPEFSRCVDNWKINYKGQKDFWEATIFGRQTTRWDSHVCITEGKDISQRLTNFGFAVTTCVPESDNEPYNTLIAASKVRRIETRETVIAKEILKCQVE